MKIIKKVFILLLLIVITACEGNVETKFDSNFNIVEEDMLHKKKLEKGVYIVEPSNDYYNLLRLYVFDSRKKSVDVFAPFDLDKQGYTSFLNFTFVIPKDGTYYLKYESYVSNPISLNIRKINYETSFKDTKPLSQNIKGEIEGLFDIDSYTYENKEEKKVGTLTNNSYLDAYVILNVGNEYDFVHTIQPDESLSFLLKEGITNIGVTHKSGLYGVMEENDVKTSYDLSFEILDLEFGRGTSGNMKELTTEYSEELYAVGLGFDNSFLILNALEKGVYEIKEKFLSENMHFGYILEDSSGNKYNTGTHGRYLLEKGQYKLTIVGDDTRLAVGKIKYSFYSIEDKEVNIEKVPEVNCSNGTFFYQEIHQLNNEKVTNDQNIKYKFALEEESCIIYNPREIIIFDKEGNRVSVQIDDRSLFIIYLLPGEYYFTTPTLSPNAQVEFGKLINYNLDNKNSLYDSTILKENETLTLKSDLPGEKELIKIVVEEICKVKITSNVDITLYNKNFDKVRIASEAQPREKLYNVLPGEYYIILEHEYGIKEATLSYKIVR